MSIKNRAPVMPLPEPAERIRLRNLFGVTQAELAAECKVTRKTVYAWEHGISSPTGHKRQTYSDVLSAWARRESVLSSEIKREGESLDVPMRPEAPHITRNHTP